MILNETLNSEPSLKYQHKSREHDYHACGETLGTELQNCVDGSMSHSKRGDVDVRLPPSRTYLSNNTEDHTPRRDVFVESFPCQTRRFSI